MTILSTILGVESGGGKNITQGNIGDINNARGTLAQGYLQITDPTWAQFGGLSTGYTSAIQAPPDVQLSVAQNIPVSRWGPATQAALLQNGYSPLPGETLGGMMNRYGEQATPVQLADGQTMNSGSFTPGYASVDPATGQVTDSSSGLNAGPNVSSDGTVNPTGPPSFPTATNTSNIPVGQGTPVAINLPKSTTTDISNWINGIETATGSAFKGAFTAIFGDVTSWLKRGFLIILGALILIVALFMLADKKTQTTILQTAKGI